MPYIDEAADPEQAGSWRAVHRVLRGDFDKARDDARKHPGRDPTVEPSEKNNGLLAVVQLRAGDKTVEPTRSFLVEDLIAMRSGLSDVSDRLDLRPSQCKHDTRAAIRAAADGDGRLLTRLFRECRTNRVSAVPLVLALAPRIRNSTQELARAVFLSVTPQQSTISLFEIVGAIAIMRDIQRGLGATAQAARLQGIVDRHLDAFTSREQLTALILLDDLSFHP